MTFTEILNDAANNVEGAMAVGLVGVDGIGVETVVSDGIDLDTESVEVELAGLVGNVSRTAQALSAGQVRDMFVEAEKQSYLISFLDSDYFLVVMLGPQANLGRARFEARRISQRLRDNLS
ncbi:MAG TPA: roadblock/LC7 domain-containing protein [Chloroflexia bacterium]|nr:roadblock/LC7 domain-containing protein [Chloroflexia bacterium]